jgi:hypothetical protein
MSAASLAAKKKHLGSTAWMKPMMRSATAAGVVDPG